MTRGQLSSSALAFDGAAASFDQRFGEWLSVASQRNAVRRELLRVFPQHGRILEIGGGTGEDARWLTAMGFRVLLTDASPSMVEIARNRLDGTGSTAEVAAAEDLEEFAAAHLGRDGRPFQGAFSNFAPLNCVEDLAPVGRGLARLVEPGGSAALVLFGIASPGEILTEVLRGRPGQALRRFRRGPVAASIGGRKFTVTYHRLREIRAAMHPWFRYVRRRGVGILVPPSAAEPWISRHPRLLHGLETLDRVANRPLAALGDHILYVFERTGVPSP